MNHTIMHFEIPANDVENIKKFYSNLFNWKIEKLPTMEYYSVTTVPMDEKGSLLRPGVNGGLYKKDQPQQLPLNYIHVESIVDYSKKNHRLRRQNLGSKNRSPGYGVVCSRPRPGRQHVRYL